MEAVGNRVVLCELAPHCGHEIPVPVALQLDAAPRWSESAALAVGASAWISTESPSLVLAVCLARPGMSAVHGMMIMCADSRGERRLQSRIAASQEQSWVPRPRYQDGFQHRDGPAADGLLHLAGRRFSSVLMSAGLREGQRV